MFAANELIWLEGKNRHFIVAVEMIYNWTDIKTEKKHL